MRLAELPALERVAPRRLVRALRQADRQRRDADAAGVEHLQRVDESLALRADERFGRHAAVLRRSPRSCRSRACRACFPSCPALKPGRAARHHERRDAVAPCARSVTAITTSVSPIAPCVMNCLVPFSTQRVAVAARRRPHRRRVAAGAGLGQAPGAELLALRERHEVRRLLRLVAEHRAGARPRGRCARPPTARSTDRRAPAPRCRCSSRRADIPAPP